MDEVNIFTADDAWKRRDAEYREWVAAGMPDADPEMIPVLKWINKGEGIRTTFCCASHPEKHYPGFYIACAVRRYHGPAMMRRVYQLLRDRWLKVIGDEPSPYCANDLTLEYSQTFAFADGEFYDSMVIRNILKTEEDKVKFFGVIESLMKEFPMHGIPEVV